MGITDSLAKRFLKQAKVISKTRAAKDAFHLTLQGRDLVNMDYIPGQHLRIFIGMDKEGNFGDKVRTYSIWHYERDNGTVQLVVCHHTQGPGSRWIRELETGEQVYLSAPKGKFIVDPSASSYLFIGDATALAHFYEIRRALPFGKKIRGIIYSAELDQLFPDLDGNYPFDFFELHENPQAQLISLLDSEQTNFLKDTIAYIGGDGRVCVALNRYFKAKGFHSKNIKTKPFWMPGKTGLE